jgi:nucleoside-diphosphate-sugar epimerase
MGPILITGASGCVGHYLVDRLLQLTDRPLWLLVRSPEKLQFDWQNHPQIEVLAGDLRELDRFADRLKQVQTAILAATCWGGPETFAVNVGQNQALMDGLDPDRCDQILYFSTASVLGRDGHLLSEALQLGTDYIRSKAECTQQLTDRPLADRITAVYPTIVLGGDRDKPYSEPTKGLPEALRYISLIRRLKVDGSFHFVHAADIARVVAHLALNPPTEPGPRHFVLGQPALTANELVDIASTVLKGRPARLKIPLSVGLADRLIDWFNIQMGPWDRFCMAYRHFTYDQVWSPASFGLETAYPTLADILRQYGRPGISGANR